jgi:hypothetical protein
MAFTKSTPNEYLSESAHKAGLSCSTLSLVAHEDIR